MVKIESWQCVINASVPTAFTWANLYGVCIGAHMKFLDCRALGGPEGQKCSCMFFLYFGKKVVQLTLKDRVL